MSLILPPSNNQGNCAGTKLSVFFFFLFDSSFGLSGFISFFWSFDHFLFVLFSFLSSFFSVFFSFLSFFFLFSFRLYILIIRSLFHVFFPLFFLSFFLSSDFFYLCFFQVNYFIFSHLYVLNWWRLFNRSLNYEFRSLNGHITKPDQASQFMKWFKCLSHFMKQVFDVTTSRTDLNLKLFHRIAGICNYSII